MSSLLALPKRLTIFITLVLVVLTQLFFVAPQIVYAASAPNLGVASTYSVFGNAGITEVAGSHLWGDVGDNGLGHANLIASQVDGNLYSVSQPTVVNAITSAYGDLAAQPQTGSIDLGGSPTVGPGVYNVGATAFNSTLTLSGDGVYIFQSTSSVAQTAGGTMLLTNGASSCNVYWQIPTSMTFGASGNIVGTIIASTGNISFVSGVNLVGRAFAHTQVTLDHNQITQPNCAAAASSASLSPAGAPVISCPPLDPQIVAPSIIDSRRVSPTSIFVSWGPYSGTNMFNVQYGFTNNDWSYSTNVTGFSTTINDLPANSPVWVRVAARNDCAIGSYGPSSGIGNYSAPTFTGSPGLPNTGFAKNMNNTSWYIVSSLLVGASILLVLIKRKHQPLGD